MDLTVGITPIVLCGGRSRRFGRDKLREALGDGSWLIDRPIAALRAVFGPRLALVGECDATLAARADRVIADRYPGKGPAGGILSAIEETGGDVFVLAGDLPCIDEKTVRAVLAASAPTEALVVLAAVIEPTPGRTLEMTSEIQPCIGLYRAGSGPFLRTTVAADRPPPLADAVPPARRVVVSIPRRAAANANTPEELRSMVDGAEA